MANVASDYEDEFVSLEVVIASAHVGRAVNRASSGAGLNGSRRAHRQINPTTMKLAPPRGCVRELNRNAPLLTHSSVRQGSGIASPGAG